MVVYVDDCDVHGPDDTEIDYIQQAFHDRFGVDVGDPANMLGVKRMITENPDGTKTLELSMPKYIENLMDEFNEHMPRDHSTPWHQDLLIGTKQRNYQPDAAEQREYKDKGYLSLCEGPLDAGKTVRNHVRSKSTMFCHVSTKPNGLERRVACAEMALQPPRQGYPIPQQLCPGTDFIL